jgi:hypothetical protein
MDEPASMHGPARYSSKAILIQHKMILMTVIGKAVPFRRHTTVSGLFVSESDIM